ncbi:hypothetical protein BH10BAC5_BH10BAC5_23040 [soil metagenome]
MNKTLLNYILNGFIILLLGLIAYLSYSLITNTSRSKNQIVKDITDTTKPTVTNQPNLMSQIDVQNATNEAGIALKMTEYLRSKGFDVVEMGNNKIKDLENTTVIDRKGDRKAAERLAKTIGIPDKKIIQQINTSLYLEATVVIGKDFRDIKPFNEKQK